MEELLKEKEKELERVEEQGCALVQNKTDEACAIVMETLQSVNHTWANLDHLVLRCLLQPTYLSELLGFIPASSISCLLLISLRS